MLIKQEGSFCEGYTPITELDGKHSDMLMDFGILKISAGKSEMSSEDKERAFLLMSGKVVFTWEGMSVEAERNSLLDENPTVLHLPAGVSAEIVALSDVEIAVQKKRNKKSFKSRLFKPEDCKSAEFGKGTLQETSTRIVRTVIDGVISPDSELVLGEVINFPGKWSSYPPHVHAQPEIYHYRFFPEQGVGFSMLGDDAYVIKNNYTCTLDPDKVHSQVSGPGYAMYYIWLIPHMEGERWSRETTYFQEDHKWLLSADAEIWPDN